MQKDIIILKDNIPMYHMGVFLDNRFGMGCAFTFDQEIKNKLYFQIQLFYQVIEVDSKIVLFEFRTLSNINFAKKLEDDNFYEDAYQLILSSIVKFENEFIKKKSTLIRARTFSPVPTLIQAKEFIRAGYRRIDFNQPLSKN